MVLTAASLSMLRRAAPGAAALGALAFCAGAAAATPTPTPGHKIGQTSVTHASPPLGPPAGGYIVRAVAPKDIELEKLPKLPDLSGYTTQAVMAKIVRKPKGHVVIQRMVSDMSLRSFVSGGHLGGGLAEFAARQSTNPVAILIEGGTMTPADLARALPSTYFEQTAPGVYILRLPLVVRQGATLHIDSTTKDFRMSEERGAFLVNDGTLFITGSRLTGWRERDNGPAKFRKKGEFRPFLVSWGGTQTYIADSVVTSLGYTASKSYGVSISQYSPGLAPIMKRPRPSGWILNSEFADNWYGFYCYEADDVVIVGNNYHHNIYYGIDPHDRSRRLIIANNKSWGASQKHGIIVSREVNDSWIFGNRTYRNHLAGIVVDRNSSGNVVANNESYDNFGDGITIYESPDNMLWGNKVVGNRRHGIRMRNSVDIRLYNNIVVANKLAGIFGHVKDLTGTERNFRLDPFELAMSMVVVGGQLIMNGSGPINLDQPLSVELYNVDIRAPTKEVGFQLRGVAGEHQEELLDILVRQQAAALIEPAGGVGKKVSTR